MKNKFLKTLGIGALCLATSIGFVGCGNGNNNDNGGTPPSQDQPASGYTTANITSLEAYQMYQTALNKYENNSLTDPSNPASARYWDNLEVTVSLSEGQTPIDLMKLSVGQTDGHDTFVEYENSNSYTVFRMESEGQYTFYQKNGETDNYTNSIFGSTSPLQSDETIFGLSDSYVVVNPLVASGFVKAEVDASNNYILYFKVSSQDKKDSWSSNKYYTIIDEYTIYINSAGNFTLYNTVETVEFSSTVTEAEKESIGGYNKTGHITYSFNYNKPFNATQAKELIQTVKDNAK